MKVSFSEWKKGITLKNRKPHASYNTVWSKVWYKHIFYKEWWTFSVLIGIESKPIGKAEECFVRFIKNKGPCNYFFFPFTGSVARWF